MTTSSLYPPGSVVEITGLCGNVELNGMLGVVKRFVTDTERFEVMLSGRRNTIAAKPANLILQESSQERRFQHAAFWPKLNRTIIPMCTFDDWPKGDNELQERRFLREKLKWTNPTVLSGIESKNVPKPNFVIYFDADDEVSPINDIAASMEQRLPDYELTKVEYVCKGRPIRGVCVLVYSPMVSTLYSSTGPSSQVLPAQNANRHFSLQELRDVLKFQESPEGIAQYKAHDNPMHRVFGGMM